MMNNAAENALRAIALGRKNWLFAGNERGGRTAATLFSLTATCRRHHVDAFAYLRDVTERLSREPRPDAETLRSLVPDRWRPPAADPPGTP
jgi:transposase